MKLLAFFILCLSQIAAIAQAEHVNKWKQIKCADWGAVQKKDVLADQTADPLFAIVEVFGGGCPLYNIGASTPQLNCWGNVGHAEISEFVTEGEQVEPERLLNNLEDVQRAKFFGACQATGTKHFANFENAYSLFTVILDSYIAKAKIAESKRAEKSKTVRATKLTEAESVKAKDSSKECLAAKARYHFCSANQYARGMELSIEREKKIGQVSGAVNPGRLRNSAAAMLNAQDKAKGYARQYQQATGTPITIDSCGIQDSETNPGTADVTADIKSPVKQFCATGI